MIWELLNNWEKNNLKLVLVNPQSPIIIRQTFFEKTQKEKEFIDFFFQTAVKYKFIDQN